MLNISQKGEIYFGICILLFAKGSWGVFGWMYFVSWFCCLPWRGWCVDGKLQNSRNEHRVSLSQEHPSRKYTTKKGAAILLPHLVLKYSILKLKQLLQRNIQRIRNVDESIERAGASGGFDSLHMILADIRFFCELHLCHALLFSVMQYVQPNAKPYVKMLVFHAYHLLLSIIPSFLSLIDNREGCKNNTMGWLSNRDVV